MVLAVPTAAEVNKTGADGNKCCCGSPIYIMFTGLRQKIAGQHHAAPSLLCMSQIPGIFKVTLVHETSMPHCAEWS